WEHSDFLCHILNGLLAALHEVYNVKKMANELWTSLDHKYKNEDIEKDNKGTGKKLSKTTTINGVKENVVDVKKDFKKGK
ncbi:hypothetical protein J1N35_022278, partial [Gossypium stocksii]